MRIALWLLLPALAMAWAGCAGPPAALPLAYTVVIDADADLNPDRLKRATPVQLRLFELKSALQFESIDFFALFDKEEQALGGDVVAKEQLTLRPGQRITLRRTAGPESRVLGVFAAFRNVEASAWRAVAVLPQAGPGGGFAPLAPSSGQARVDIRLHRLAVSAASSGPGLPPPAQPGGAALPVDPAAVSASPPPGEH